jgi:dihydrolipoamide dehydrogenase
MRILMEQKSYDIIVLGAGPGGYVAAIKAAQNNKKVALIEKNFVGGTCLNVGCIPTKSLISNAHVLHTIKKAKLYGINTENISFDFSEMKKRKDNVVENLRNSLFGLIKANGVDIYKGSGKFLSPNEIKVIGDDNILLSGDKIIIATGSEPANIKAFNCDNKLVRNSTGVLELENLPKKLAIIGGGYIGCEFASLYSILGVEVVILEALPTILFSMGKIISKTIADSLKKNSVEIITDVKVTNIEKSNNSVTINIDGKDPILADMALISIGRKFNSDNIDLAKAGVLTNEKGEIIVNDKMQTNVDNIYAIGDITGKFMLAHVASHGAMVAVDNACGNEKKMHYNCVPAVIFTIPEVATVGLSKEDAQKQNINIKIAKYPFSALGKSQACLETDGFVEIIVDDEFGQILGASALGEGASVLIAQMALAISNELTIDCITDTIHAHPTIPEAWMEAAFIASGKPLHFPPKK